MNPSQCCHQANSSEWCVVIIVILLNCYHRTNNCHQTHDHPNHTTKYNQGQDCYHQQMLKLHNKCLLHKSGRILAFKPSYIEHFSNSNRQGVQGLIIALSVTIYKHVPTIKVLLLCNFQLICVALLMKDICFNILISAGHLSQLAQAKPPPLSV